MPRLVPFALLGSQCEWGHSVFSCLNLIPQTSLSLILSGFIPFSSLQIQWTLPPPFRYLVNLFLEFSFLMFFIHSASDFFNLVNSHLASSLRLDDISSGKPFCLITRLGALITCSQSKTHSLSYFSYFSLIASHTQSLSHSIRFVHERITVSHPPVYS